MPNHPELLWAQRSSETDEEKNVIFLTINLPDIVEKSVELDLKSTGISFKARTGDDSKNIPEKEYAFELEFFKEIVPEKSSRRVTSRSIVLKLQKAEKAAEYWPRLTKEKVKLNFLKTDFSRWVDEDEQDGEVAAPEEDLDPMGGMGGMPGMGGMGGMPGMGGMGGMPGMGGMDIQKMLAEMGQGGGLGGGDDDEAGPSGVKADDDDSDDDGPPPLEDAPAKP